MSLRPSTHASSVCWRSVLPVLLLVMGGALSPALAATYHVDASAETDSDGSLEKPFKAIQRAANVLKPGDVCLIRNGKVLASRTP